MTILTKWVEETGNRINVLFLNMVQLQATGQAFRGPPTPHRLGTYQGKRPFSLHPWCPCFDDKEKKRKIKGKDRERKSERRSEQNGRVIFKEQEWPKMSSFFQDRKVKKTELERSATHCLRRLKKLHENRHVMVSKWLASNQKGPIRLRKHHTIHVGIATDNINTNGWFGLRFRRVHNSLFSHFLLPL